jgi:preprotein translocase subunit YajC
MKKILGMVAMATVAVSSLFGEEMAPPREQGMWQTMVLIAIAMGFFYFIMWRPEQKRRKEMEAQRNAMKKGDRVTAMGIIGEVHKVNEHTVVLKMIDGSKIEFLKAAVTDVLPEGAASSESSEKEGQ